MKVASLTELKKELLTLNPAKVVEVCLRLSRYKKENKELLAYLLFESQKEDSYCQSVKTFVDTQFEELPRYNSYQTVKGIRKILRLLNRYIKYSGIKETEVTLLIYFLGKLKSEPSKIYTTPVIMKMADTQLAKIRKSIVKLHEDLQYDYEQELEKLN